MGRYRESVCRICRRENQKLFLKGAKCYTDKCGVAKRAFPAGQHGLSRKRLSDYGIQLREKQKVKRIYGLLEKQFRNYYESAVKSGGITGEVLLSTLESRLDSVLYRMGVASSRNQARQYVSHGKVLINGKRVDIPAYLVKKGDVISFIKEFPATTAEGYEAPVWIKFNNSKKQAEIMALPKRDDVGEEVNENLIVEFYSR